MKFIKNNGLVIILLFALYLGYNGSLYGQNYSSENPEYIANVKLGEKALMNEDYDSCMVYYRRAFNIQQTSVLSTLRSAACAFSGGYAYEYVKHLDKAFELNWSGAKNIFDRFSEFSYLKETPFERDILERYIQNAREAGVNLELMAELVEIAKLDQAQRQEMGNFEWGSPQMDSLWRIQNLSDSLNTDHIVEIIEEYGYPGRTLVGPEQAGTAFLVIQHADLEVQEKYLPIIIAAADSNEVAWSAVALLIDRVNLRQGKRQIYGSQIAIADDGTFYVSPIEDPYNVDQKRASVGLEPIQEYIANWDMVWDVEKHIKIWELLEENKKKDDSNK